MKKLKVMMMTLMMCLVSMSVGGQNERTNNIDESNIITSITKTINIDNKLDITNNDSIYSNNGTIYNLQNTDKIFNLQGIDVTKLNGSLILGGYIVKFNDNTSTKILVK